MDQLYREKVRETVLHCWVGNIAIIQYSPLASESKPGKGLS